MLQFKIDDGPKDWKYGPDATAATFVLQEWLENQQRHHKYHPHCPGCGRFIRSEETHCGDCGDY